MKKLLFLFVMVCSITFPAKADNPPTGNENSTSTTEEISVPDRPDCIPEGWQYEGRYQSKATSCRWENRFVDVWSSSSCGAKQYKVVCTITGGHYCLNAYYNASEHIMTYYDRDCELVFRF